MIIHRESVRTPFSLRLGRCILSVSLAILSSASAHATVTLSHIFSDHMVLQRNQPVPIWGKAAAGEQVTVSFNGQNVSATADSSGAWKIKLAQMSAGGPFVMDIKGTNSTSIQDVYVGEVWLASGQSNMHHIVSTALNSDQEIASANFPLIRMFNAEPQVARTPQDDVKGAWLVASPQTVANFSAVGFFFARELQKQLNVPIGIVNSSFDWTPAESWVSREGLSSDPELKQDILGDWDQIDATFADKSAKFPAIQKAWQAAGSKPPQPLPPRDPMFFHRASGLWNGGIAPLVPYAVRGIIWWQGETNADSQRGYQYRTLFQALITDWRKHWNNQSLPFYWVQLSSVLKEDPTPVESEWAEVREAQAMALALPDTGMAVGIDLGEPPDNVHPRNKQAFAHRLALIALHNVYGKDVDFSGPVYKSMKIEGNKIRLSFDSIDQGLATPNNAPLAGFDLAGADHKFVHGTAVIDGNDVVVSADSIPAPVAVRYAWANNPIKSNLNAKTRAGELLPAVPFRTDQWPGKTVGKSRMTIDDMGS